MDDEKAVIVLIENELYRLRLIKENYKGAEAEKLIQDFTEDFKETVLKKYNI